jgi:hypothetical protein
MQRNNSSRFFPLIIIIIVIALVIAAVISIGRAVFNSSKSSSDDQTSQTDTTAGRDSLLDTSTGRSVKMTIRGPIVADESFTSYQINASNSERSMNVYKGYVDQLTNGKTLPNNTQAYEQFVYALDKANMMKGKSDTSKDKQDLRGICAGGYVYEFAVLNAGSPVESLWTSTCGGSKGTLNASKDQLTRLFLAQIPDSKSLIPFKQSQTLNF